MKWNMHGQKKHQDLSDGEEGERERENMISRIRILHVLDYIYSETSE